MTEQVDAERAILGAALVRPSALDTALAAGWTPADCTIPDHRSAAEAMVRLQERGAPLDPVTVAADAANGAGAHRQDALLLLLGDCQASMPTAENVAQYARIVRDAAVLRTLAVTAAEIAAGARRAPVGQVEDVCAEAERAILAATARLYAAAESTRDLRSLLPGVLAAFEDRAARPGAVTGVPTGIATLDRLTGGLQAGQLVIVAGRPSGGKTSLACWLALSAARAGQPVLLFSLEMRGPEIVERLVASTAALRGDWLREGRLTAPQWQEANAAAGLLARLPFVVDDAPVSDLPRIRACARRWVGDRRRWPQGSIGLVIVDYVQLVRPHERGQTREREVAAVSGGLKALARELSLPVVALSQLRRAPEEQERPRLADLRESGALEQDAVLVLILWRPKAAKDPRAVRLYIAKHRAGEAGIDVPLAFDRAVMRFSEENTW